MAVGRQVNWKGQWRVDVAHLRLLESSIVYDFDTLAGLALGGGLPYILTGFEIASWTVGTAPTTLQITTADSVLFNYLASENGTMLTVPSDRAVETLSTSNARVVGGFTANTTNYIAVDLIRAEDSSTSDIVQFTDATTLVPTPKTVPLGRTLDYRINISIVPFSSTPHLCPVAKVVTDANGLIDTNGVTDARNMYFRLAEGGDSPNPLGTYDWPQGRAPEVPTSFTGGDKAITNEKTWKSAIMQRLWEVTGGEYWYSDVTDRNLKFYCATAQPFTWTLGSSTLAWSDALKIALDNSSATVNTIDAGSKVLADGEVAYVELNRFSNTPSLTVNVVTTAAYNALAAPARPGSRYIVFWRKGNFVYTRLDYTPVGVGSVAVATHTTLGAVKTSGLNTTVVGGPFVVLANSDGGKALATGITRGTSGGDTVGNGTFYIATDTTNTSIELGNNATTVEVRSLATFHNTTGIYAFAYLGASPGTPPIIRGPGGALGAAGTSVAIESEATITSGYIVKFSNNGTYKAYITKDGDGYFVGNVTAYSDLRLKTGITTFPNALDKVMAMRGVNYRRIDGDGKVNVGVIAQEVEAVVPEVVHTDADGMKAVSYGNLVGVLIEAIKELKAEIDVLKGK